MKKITIKKNTNNINTIKKYNFCEKNLLKIH